MTGKEPQRPLSKDLNPAENILMELEGLAVVRTAFSSERSLLAWMRTSASTFTLGFAIIKFFDYLEQCNFARFSDGPRQLGLVLIWVGVLALMPALVEHVRRLRKMKELGLSTNYRFSLPVAASAALLATGITALIGITLNW